MWSLPDRVFFQVIHEKNWKRLGVQGHFHPPVHAGNLVANLAHLANHHSVILRRHLFWVFFDFWCLMRHVSQHFHTRTLTFFC